MYQGKNWKTTSSRGGKGNLQKDMNFMYTFNTKYRMVCGLSVEKVEKHTGINHFNFRIMFVEKGLSDKVGI